MRYKSWIRSLVAKAALMPDYTSIELTPEEMKEAILEGQKRKWFRLNRGIKGDRELEEENAAKLARLIEYITQNPFILEAMQIVWSRGRFEWCDDGKLEFKKLAKQLKIFHENQKAA